MNYTRWRYSATGKNRMAHSFPENFSSSFNYLPVYLSTSQAPGHDGRFQLSVKFQCPKETNQTTDTAQNRTWEQTSPW
jgi:hypothetical protein